MIPSLRGGLVSTARPVADEERLRGDGGRHPGPALTSLQDPGGALELFCMPVPKVPRLLIIGAGPDASPLASLAAMLEEVMVA